MLAEKIQGYELVVFGCCGAHVYLADNFMKDKRDRKESFFCPIGHERAFHESTAEKLQKQLNTANAQLGSEISGRVKAEVQLSAAERRIKRLEKKHG